MEISTNWGHILLCLIPQPLQYHVHVIVILLRVNLENPLHHLGKVDSSQLILEQSRRVVAT